MLQNDSKPLKNTDESHTNKKKEKRIVKSGSNNSLWSILSRGGEKCSKLSKNKNDYLSKSTTTLATDVLTDPLSNSLKQRVNSESRLDTFSYLSSGIKTDISASLPDNRHLDDNGLNTNALGKNCNKCKCCKILEKKVDMLKAQLDWYANFFKMTPEVLAWFDQIKPSIVEFSSALRLKSSGMATLEKKPFSHSYGDGLNLNDQSLRKSADVPEIRIDSSESF